MDDFANGIMGIMGLIVLYVIYTLPMRIAKNNNHANRKAIAATTLLTGWTGIGWVIALIWSLTKQK